MTISPYFLLLAPYAAFIESGHWQGIDVLHHSLRATSTMLGKLVLAINKKIQQGRWGQVMFVWVYNWWHGSTCNTSVIRTATNWVRGPSLSASCLTQQRVDAKGQGRQGTSSIFHVLLQTSLQLPAFRFRKFWSKGSTSTYHVQHLLMALSSMNLSNSLLNRVKQSAFTVSYGNEFHKSPLCVTASQHCHEVKTACGTRPGSLVSSFTPTQSGL